MTTLRLALALVTAFGALAPEAGASVLCRTTTRAVVERAACRARETPIPLSDVGPAGLAGSPGPTGATGRGTASIVDAAGTAVGPVFHLREIPGPARPEEPIAFAVLDHQAVGGLAAIGVASDGRGAGTVYYADPGCSGTAFVVAAGFLPELQIIADSVFLPVTPAPRTVVIAEETSDHSHTCVAVTPRGGCCVMLANPQTISAGFLAVAGQTTLEALGLRAPFSARAE